MPKFPYRALAVLTVVALAGSCAVLADEPAGTGRIFRDSTAWTVADGVISLTGPATRESPLYTRLALADSVTHFEFRSPKGARADAYLQGRYVVELVGTGDWQRVDIRFRADTGTAAARRS